MIDVDQAMAFVHFVTERHRVWEKRQAGEPQPWTDDPVLATRKFTNVFRVLDPGSQFVVTSLLSDDPDPADFLMRCFLYRHTNLPEAWRAVRADLGEYPTRENLESVREIFHDIKRAGGRVFSGAYMIYPQSSVPGTDKIDSIIDLTKSLFVQSQIDVQFLRAETQADRFAVLRRNKGVADFMSMQILTDFGYSTEFREDEFVVPGPGARKGAAFLWMEAEEAIEWGWSTLSRMDDQPMFWGSGNRGHFLSRMDVQNCLCEFSKYVRFGSKPSPQKSYSPAHPGLQLKPVLPPMWHTTI